MNLRPFVCSAFALLVLPALAEPIQTGLEAEEPSAVTDTATLTRELFQACEQGDTEKVRILLQQGAEVNVRNMKDFTPVGIAIKNGHTANFLRDFSAPMQLASLRSAPSLRSGRRIYAVNCKIKCDTL